jgi:hypothetical protein
VFKITWEMTCSSFANAVFFKINLIELFVVSSVGVLYIIAILFSSCSKSQ